jgi:outer membrane protein OmpA-like peptidoglycan-associated protein
VITLQADKKYAVHTARLGYQEVSDTVALTKEYAAKPLTHNVAMLPFGYNPIKPINDSLIGEVHFDVNVAELSAADKATLQAIISPWLEEKGIVIYVNAYTDNTGTPMINETLSFKRSEIVAKEIISMGIDESMVEPKGWGEANPIASNDSEEGRSKNRRVEIIVKR